MAYKSMRVDIMITEIRVARPRINITYLWCAKTRLKNAPLDDKYFDLQPPVSMYLQSLSLSFRPDYARIVLS